MATILERIRRGLAPDYEVVEELAQGGMGVVFLARDVALDRRVAIKIVRPEFATANALLRFVREARLLARLHHPNVLPVHRAGEVDGIAYYVMEYIDGETLASRLERGPLAIPEVLKLGRDLLDALQAVHQLGTVHRDVKPSNIFLVGNRAILADFGIARSRSIGEAATAPGGTPGTPGYMSPEQQAGDEDLSPASDLYAAAAVLYEAATGRRAKAPTPPEEMDWTGVPRFLGSHLRRGLAWSGDARWPDAASFRHALWKVRTRPYVRGAVALTSAGIALGAGAVFFARSLSDRPAGHPLIRVEAFHASSAAAPGLGDSLAHLLALDLTGYPDFAVAGPGAVGRANVVLGGTVVQGADSICADVRSAKRLSTRDVVAHACVANGELDELVRHLAGLVLLEVWTGQRAALTDLPRDKLPRGAEALAAFFEGERAFAHSLWGEALKAYTRAETIDSTCRLCSWRVYDAERWLGVAHDPRRIARFVQAADSFPPPYRSLMHAPGVSLAARLDTLQRAALQSFRSPLVFWSLGEELLHRGPLAGHARREAIEPFAVAASLRPDFAPAWEHLAWGYTAEGDSAGADSALHRWHTALGGPPADTFTIALQSLLETGFAWRFLDTATAARQLRAALRRPEIAGSSILVVAPRLLPTFDALLGVVWLGREFSADHRPQFRRSGLLSLVFGFTALGRPDSAAASLRTLVRQFPDAELQTFAAQFRAALFLTDPAAFPSHGSAIQRELSRLAGGAHPELERRVAWSSAMVAAVDSNSPRSGADAGIQLSRQQQSLVAAALAARQGRWAQAVTQTDDIERDSAAQVSDPTLRSVLRLLRAAWQERGGSPEAARRELRWAEHYATVNWPVGPPQTADVDWAFRTLARWRRARVLDAAGTTDWELCASYQAVARDWKLGAPPYAARADTARARFAALGCRRFT